MKVTYFAGLVRHLVKHSGTGVAKTETFAEVGAAGFSWPPEGVKVTFGDGTAVFLSSSRTSPDQGDDPDQPTEFRPEDLHVPSV